MAKRRQLRPWPDTVWHASGRVRDVSALDAVRDHLDDSVEDGSIADSRSYFPEGDYWWWGIDATWQTSEGDRVKARLLLAPDPILSKRKGMVRHAMDVPLLKGDLFWSLTAEADRPWQPHWRSPVDVMFGGLQVFDWVSGQLFLLDETGAIDLSAELLAQQFEELAGCPWYIPVITHDKRPLEEARQYQGPALVDLVPPSLRGRLVEFRVYGDQDRIVNTDGVLPESRLRLKLGGALIVPPKPLPDEWSMSDCIIRRPAGSDFEQLLKETADVVTRYAALRPHFCDRARAGVENLRKSWVLEEIPLASARVLQEKQEAEERISELETLLAETKDLLRSEREQAHLVYVAKEAAKERLQELERNPLSEQARQFRQEAEEAWAAQDRAEALTEDLVAQVAWLRRKLAQQGGSYNEPAPERPAGPESWAELFELAGELLPRINILDCAMEPVKKLRGHSWEQRWLRRTWESLEALNAYALAKTSPEGAHLAHFSAYLDWPQASEVISKALYVPHEVLLERSGNTDARRTRMFHVEELGEVFMGAHIRIGTGKPPAPRMYFYDDAPGKTGRIHVGYIGPHLPNWAGK